VVVASSFWLQCEAMHLLCPLATTALELDLFIGDAKTRAVNVRLRAPTCPAIARYLGAPSWPPCRGSATTSLSTTHGPWTLFPPTGIHFLSMSQRRICSTTASWSWTGTSTACSRCPCTCAASCIVSILCVRGWPAFHVHALGQVANAPIACSWAAA
jgi:hypothetical protein